MSVMKSPGNRCNEIKQTVLHVSYVVSVRNWLIREPLLDINFSSTFKQCIDLAVMIHALRNKWSLRKSEVSCSVPSTFVLLCTCYF